MPTKPADNQVKTGYVNPVGYALGLPRLGLTVVLALAVALGSCTGANPVFPIIPKITFTSLTRRFERSGFAANELLSAIGSSGSESLTLTLQFEDGDGDLGGAASSQNDFVVKEIRPDLPNAYPYTINNSGIPTTITEFVNSGKIPSLESDTRSPSVEGTIRFNIFDREALPLDTCLRSANPAGFRQAVRFEVYLIDRAGHRSNTITTSDVFIRCQ
jgi:hypothetical protein